MNAAVTGSLVGAHALTGNATDNTIDIKANVTGNIVGAQAHTSARRNALDIGSGITVDGNVTGGIGAVTDENIVNLKGASVTGTVSGGTGTSTVGNTLAVRYDKDRGSTIGDFANIKNLHFYLADGVSGSTPSLLTLNKTNHKDIRDMNIGVGVSGSARTLSVNDTISLMKVAGTGTNTLDMHNPTANKIKGMQGVSLLYEFELRKRGTNELVATVTKATIGDQTKSFVETKTGATDFINQGSDLLTFDGISIGKKDRAGNKKKNLKGYHLWAATAQSKLRVETGSHVTTGGYNLAVGWAREDEHAYGSTMFSPFIEYGKGNYDSYLDDGTHGSGGFSYLGGGVIGRIDRMDGLFAEAVVHGGKARSDYSGSVYQGTMTTYSSANTYLAAHMGIGKEIRTNEKDSVSAYLRYYWSRQAGAKARLNSGEEYTFGSVTSSRVRLGMRYAHTDSEHSAVYAGLGWEYELNGRAQANYAGYNTPVSSLRGGSALLEVGYRCAPRDSRFSYDMHVTGWQGKRQGVTGSAHLNWAF